MLRINKIILCALCSVLCALALSCASALAEGPSSVITPELSPKEPIVVNGDRVEYYQEQKKVVGLGNVSITYKDVVLTCERITVYLDTREGIAEGNVRVVQKDAVLTGERMNYNFDTRQGTILKSTYTSFPFYGKARDVEKVAYKDQYNLDRGYITTCDLDEKPHYRLQARRVKIYLDDRIEAQHILMFVGKMPVMYFPYYSQPFEGGKNNFTITPGQRDDWGYYVLTAFRYQLDGYNRGDILLDYRSKRGLAEGLNHYYRTDEIGDGAFKFYNTKDYYRYLIYRYEKESPTVYRYRYQWRHKWELTEKDTSFVVQFNRLSDPNIIKDFIYNEYEEEGATPDTFFSAITTKPDYNTQLLVRKRFGKFQTIVERLPEYNISIPYYNIMDTGLYYTGYANGVYLNKTFDNLTRCPPAEPQKDLNITRFDTYNKLSYAAKLFGSLSVTPYGAVQNTYFSRNVWGDTNLIRTVFSAGVENSIKFYRIYDVKSDILGLDINKLRHIITPTVNYYFIRQPTIDPTNLIQFDGIDAITKANSVNFGLENRLQTKRLEAGQMKSVDLATLYVNVPYVFRLKKKDPTAFVNHTQYFTSVDLQLELIPYSWLKSVSKMSINTKNQAVRTLSVDLAGSQGDKWSLGGGYIYLKEETGLENVATVSGMYKINDKWRARVYERFAIRKSFQEQQYTISRDFHCWSVELTYDYTKGDRHDLYFMVRLKAFPQYPIGLRRTYSRPEFGRREEGTNYEGIT